VATNVAIVFADTAAAIDVVAVLVAARTVAAQITFRAVGTLAEAVVAAVVVVVAAERRQG
jgi:hypothetical protein